MSMPVIEAHSAEKIHLLTQVSRRIASILNVDELMVQVAQLIQQTFGFYHVGIGLIEGEAVVYRVGAGELWDRSDFQFKPARLKVGKEGITGWVAATGSSLLIPDVNQDQRYVWMQGSETRSELTVPISVKGQVIGVLDVQSNELNAFDTTDLELMLALASQTGVAIENARLFAAEKHRAEQFRVLTEVSQRITSILDIDELLIRVVTLIHQTFGYYLVVLGMVEGDELLFRLGAGSLWNSLQFQGNPPRLRIGKESVSGWVVVTGEAALVPDVSQEPRYVAVQNSQTHSEFIAPIKVGGKVIGILDVESDRLNAFDETDVELISSLANQAGIAIENARLFSAEQRRAEQFRVLTEVSQRIISLTSVDELLGNIARTIKESFGYLHVGIGLVEGNEVISRAEAGVFEETYRSARIPLGHGIWGWVAQYGQPLVSGQVSGDLEHAHFDQAGIRSHVCVPLKVKDMVIGVMSAASDRVGAFDQSDEIILQTLANQASVAIENVHLHEQEKRIAILEERQRLARELHDSVTQALYGITLYSQAAAGQLALNHLEQVDKHLQEINETSQEALAEMRLLIYQLRPPVLEKEGILTALQARLTAVEGRAGLKTNLKADLTTRLPPAIEEGLYHIAQEALNNTLKHAHARLVSVFLRQKGSLVILEIVDDGIGFDIASAYQNGKMGLSDMEEHAIEIGGRLSVVSESGQGTRIRVEVEL